MWRTLHDLFACLHSSYSRSICYAFPVPKVETNVSIAMCAQLWRGLTPPHTHTKISYLLTSFFILIVQFIFYIGNSFWYNCGLHKTHLLWNVLFYASAVHTCDLKVLSVLIIYLQCQRGSSDKRQQGLPVFHIIDASQITPSEEAKLHMVCMQGESPRNWDGDIKWNLFLPQSLVYWLL